MIKPIIYHSFEEKEQLEKVLMAKIPAQKRKAVAKALMEIFSRSENSKESNREK